MNNQHGNIITNDKDQFQQTKIRDVFIETFCETNILCNQIVNAVLNENNNMNDITRAIIAYSKTIDALNVETIFSAKMESLNKSYWNDILDILSCLAIVTQNHLEHKCSQTLVQEYLQQCVSTNLVTWVMLRGGWSEFNNFIKLKQSTKLSIYNSRAKFYKFFIGITGLSIGLGSLYFFRKSLNINKLFSSLTK
jgi:hypothetical protein